MYTFLDCILAEYPNFFTIDESTNVGISVVNTLLGFFEDDFFLKIPDIWIKIFPNHWGCGKVCLKEASDEKASAVNEG